MNSINFVFSVEKIRKISLYSAFAVVLALLFSIVYMIADAGTMRGKLPAMKARLESLKAKRSALITPKMPGEKEVESLEKKVAAVNALKINKSGGVSRILRELEKLTASGVSYYSLQYNAADNSLRVGARAKSPEIIPVFMETVEKDNMFMKVALEKQSQKEASAGARTADFTITAEENLK